MHSLILGQSESGKSFLAKRFAVEFAKSGRKVAVLDPLGTKWSAAYQTHKPDDFLMYARSNTNCMLFVDECGEALRLLDETKNARDIHWLATRGRHLGHSCFFIGQRATQIPPTMRDQCKTLYVFNQSVKDGAILASEFNKPFVANVNTLQKGEFYRVDRYGLKQFGKIDFRLNRFDIRPIEEK